MLTELNTSVQNKTEQAMCRAVYYTLNWAKDNTCVKVEGDEAAGAMKVFVYLYDSHIATLMETFPEGFKLEVQLNALKSRPTNLMISRLRALGAQISVKDGKIFLDDKFICERL